MINAEHTHITASRPERLPCLAAAALLVLLIACVNFAPEEEDEGRPYNLKGDFCIRLLRPDLAASLCVGESLTVVIASKPTEYQVNAMVELSIDSGTTWNNIGNDKPYSLLNSICTLKVRIPDSVSLWAWDPVKAIGVDSMVSSVSDKVFLKVRDYDTQQKPDCYDVSDEMFSIVACP